LTEERGVVVEMQEQPKPPTYIVTLPSYHVGWWERARQTLSTKEFHRLIADVATGARAIMSPLRETIEVEE